MPYNFVADSIHTKKRYRIADFFQVKCIILTEKVFEPQE